MGEVHGSLATELVGAESGLRAKKKGATFVAPFDPSTTCHYGTSERLVPYFVLMTPINWLAIRI
jgi:hypothetical protein